MTVSLEDHPLIRSSDWVQCQRVGWNPESRHELMTSGVTGGAMEGATEGAREFRECLADPGKRRRA